jgi:hypothetical protein
MIAGKALLIQSLPAYLARTPNKGQGFPLSGLYQPFDPFRKLLQALSRFRPKFSSFFGGTLSKIPNQVNQSLHALQNDRDVMKSFENQPISPYFLRSLVPVLDRRMANSKMMP